jgi:hypothetical protein
VIDLAIREAIYSLKEIADAVNKDALSEMLERVARAQEILALVAALGVTSAPEDSEAIHQSINKLARDLCV